jgi:hypothetical protein
MRRQNSVTGQLSGSPDGGSKNPFLLTLAHRTSRSSDWGPCSSGRWPDGPLNPCRGGRMEQLQEKALNINTDGSCHVPWSGRRRLLVRIDRQAWMASDPRGVPSGMAIGNEQPDGAPGVHRSLGLALGRRSPVDMAEFDKIVILTDSQYVVNTFDKAKFEWPGTRWTTRGGAPVANTTQWKELNAPGEEGRGSGGGTVGQGACEGPLEQDGGPTRQAVGEDAQCPAARSSASSSTDEPRFRPNWEASESKAGSSRSGSSLTNGSPRLIAATGTSTR